MFWYQTLHIGFKIHFFKNPHFLKDKPGARCDGIAILCENPQYQSALRENCKATCKMCNVQCKDATTVCGTW